MKNKLEKSIFISISELAKMLGISRIAVFKKIKKGQIPAIKIGRSYAISGDDVNNILQDNKSNILSKNKKDKINKAVKMIVEEYGETLKLLGKE